MKTGWLVINSFLQTEKFLTLYKLLKAAAESRGIVLDCKRTDELCIPVGEAFSKRFPALPHFVLFWDKDVSLARRMEAAGLKLFNGAQGIEVCDNKILTAEALSAAGIAAPKTVIAPKTFEGVGYNDKSFLLCAEKELGYPMVIKEAYGSFGAQVYLAQDRAEACAILEKIGHKDCLLQQFIKASAGRDIRANVVGEKVVAAMERYNDNDFRSNVSGGGKTRKIELTKAQEAIAVAAARACGVHFAGVDILTDEGGKPLVCEVNSNPQFKSTLDCTGVDVSEYVMQYIAERI